MLLHRNRGWKVGKRRFSPCPSFTVESPGYRGIGEPWDAEAVGPLLWGLTFQFQLLQSTGRARVQCALVNFDEVASPCLRSFPPEEDRR